MSKTVKLFDFRWYGVCYSKECEPCYYTRTPHKLSKPFPKDEETKCPVCGKEMEIELYAELEERG